MMKKILWALPILLASCFLFKDYKQTAFQYSRNGQAATMPLIVPRGYTKTERIDTAGISMQTFHYPGGAVMYAAYLADTSVQIQPFDKTVHQPLIHRLGGLVYKGQNDNLLFFREIRQGNMRFGYRDVPSLNEGYFDSATNHASLQRR